MERHISVWSLLVHPQVGTWPATHPGMCPDWESNMQPFGSQADTQSIEPHQPGPLLFFCIQKPFSDLGVTNNATIL